MAIDNMLADGLRSALDDGDVNVRGGLVRIGFSNMPSETDTG